jgi:hypothetical protein
MIVTSRLSIEIVRYLNRRTQGAPHQWTTLGEIADYIYGAPDLAFNQAVDLARCRGWIIVEGNFTSRRACLTKAGCSLDLPVGPTVANHSSHHLLLAMGERGGKNKARLSRIGRE